MALFEWAEDDRATRRLVVAQLVNAKLVTRVEVARVFGLHVNTVSRIAQQVAAEGVTAWALLADGRVVGTAAGASVFSANMADMTPIRAADSRFVLDQLGRLNEKRRTEPQVSGSHRKLPTVHAAYAVGGRHRCRVRKFD